MIITLYLLFKIYTVNYINLCYKMHTKVYISYPSFCLSQMKPTTAEQSTFCHNYKY